MNPCTTNNNTRSLLLGCLVISLLIGCTSGKRSEDPAQWSEAQAEEWFNQKEWLGTSDLKPDASIDKKDFAVRYHHNKQNWDKAFAFLTKEDLDTLSVGRHEIDGKNVFATVSEYNTKNPEDAQYESHKDYTDLQYIISGAEQIGLAELSATSVKTPYDKDKDIAFYTASKDQMLLAKPGTFFIFFPDDAHSPGRKLDTNLPIKKLVIKVGN